MLNQYLNAPETALVAEQDLLFDLIEENIQGGGIETSYILRDQENLDILMGDATLNKFKDKFNIEMSIEQIVGFNGEGDIFAKFGIESNDQATLICSTRRFIMEADKFNLTKPVKGDLIYVGLNNSLWEIRNVKKDLELQQFGQNYTWRIDVSLYSFDHNDVVDIDDKSFRAESNIQDDDIILRELLKTNDNISDDANNELNDIRIQDFNQFDPFGSL